MSLFGVLGNAQGQRSLASRVVPRRRVKRLPSERLAAARLAGILLLLDDASPTAARRQLDAADPQHVSAARQPRHARELPVAPAPEVLESEVLASVVPGAGRHRRPGVRAVMALRGVRVAPPRVVLLGLLVLLVAFAAVLGVRGSATLESAQPHADAATSHSATVIVPGTR